VHEIAQKLHKAQYLNNHSTSSISK